MGDTPGIVIVVAVIGVFGSAIAAMLTGRVGVIGTLQKRIGELERVEEKCQNELYALRQDVTDMYLLNEILFQTCPDVFEQAGAIRARIAERMNARKVGAQMREKYGADNGGASNNG